MHSTFRANQPVSTESGPVSSHTTTSPILTAVSQPVRLWRRHSKPPEWLELARLAFEQQTILLFCIMVSPMIDLIHWAKLSDIFLIMLPLQPSTNHRFWVEYRLISKKGEGTFSEVLKAQSIKTGKYVAIKCMKNHFDTIEQVNNLREIQALRRLSPHPQIIKLYEVL